MTVLQLREDVLIVPFDEDDDSQRYVAAVDGRQFVISAGLAVLLDVMRAPATLGLVAQRTSERTGVCITAEELEVLLRERLPPMLFHADSDPTPLVGPAHLRFRPWSAERLAPLLHSLSTLFTWRAMLALLVAFLCTQVLVASQAPPVLTQGATANDAVLGIALTLAGMAFHEMGHLTACHRLGFRHGGAGFGMYWCFPVIEAHVHGAWMMPSLQRSVVHGAGIYFQCVYLTAVGALYLCIESPALLFAVTWSNVLLMHAINPLFKFDGHWHLAALAGVHDLHRKIGEVTRSLLRGERPQTGETSLLAAFVIGTGSYLIFLTTALADGLARTTAALSLGTVDRGETSVALGISVVIILVIVTAIARAMHAVFLERSHDR